VGRPRGVVDMANLRAVSTPQPTTLDYGTVESRIRAQSPYEEGRNRQFARYICQEFFQIPDGDVSQCITDGFHDNGVDIVYIDDSSHTINICNCKTVEKYKNALKHFPGSEIDKISTFLHILMYRKEEALSQLNPSLANWVRKIWDILSEDEWKVQINLFSNQLPLTIQDRQRFITLISDHRNIELDEHHLYELAHGSVISSRPNFKKKLILLQNCAYMVEENGHKGLQTRVSLENLANFVSTVENHRVFDERLLHHNVRYFLGQDNAVNKSIKESLSGESAHNFWFLNNGLTIVCDGVIGIANGCHQITLINPQIVNGGQTSRVLHNRFCNDIVAGPDGSIQLKIIQTKDLKFINEIAFASNNQSRIYGRDFRANDMRQLKLATALASEGVFYRRKRGEKANFDARITVDLFRTGQLLLTILQKEPVRAKTVSHELFGDLYEQVFDETRLTPELIVSCHKIDSLLESKRAVIIANQTKAMGAEFEEPWIIEGHFHVLFVASELLRRETLDVTRVENFEPYVDEAIRIVTRFVQSHSGVSGYRLFRTAASKIGLLKIMDQTSHAVEEVQFEMNLWREL
jgi:AIPR protein